MTKFADLKEVVKLLNELTRETIRDLPELIEELRGGPPDKRPRTLLSSSYRNKCGRYKLKTARVEFVPFIGDVVIAYETTLNFEANYLLPRMWSQIGTFVDESQEKATKRYFDLADRVRNNALPEHLEGHWDYRYMKPKLPRS
jgi:hypothetical protein